MLRRLELVSKRKALPSDIQSEWVDFSLGMMTSLCAAGGDSSAVESVSDGQTALECISYWLK